MAEFTILVENYRCVVFSRAIGQFNARPTRDAWEIHQTTRDGNACHAHPVDGMEPMEDAGDADDRIKEKSAPLLNRIFKSDFIALEVHLKNQMPRDISGSELVSIMVEAMRAVWVWAAQAKTANAMALRLYVMLYVFEPALVEGITLQRIGTATNNSRQHVHALLDEFRSTFGVTNHLEKNPCRTRN